jgi:hypothetical protein
MARNLPRNAPNTIRESQETWLQSSRRFETPQSEIEDNSMDMLHPQFQPPPKEEPWLNTRNPIDFSVLENFSQDPHLFSSGNRYQEPESVRGTASYMKEQTHDSLFSSDLNPGVTSKSNSPQFPIQGIRHDKFYIDQQVKSQVDTTIAGLRQSLVSNIVAAIHIPRPVLPLAEVSPELDNLPSN